MASRRLKFEVPLPPSVNSLYVKRRGKNGAVALTDVARKYREDIKRIVSEQIVDVAIAIKNDDGYGSEIYGMKMTIGLSGLENPEWFRGARSGGKLKVKLRYKRIDVDNRIKFVQDWITKCLGIDDSLIFETIARKVESSTESVLVEVYQLPNRDEFLLPRKDPDWLEEWRRNGE